MCNKQNELEERAAVASQQLSTTYDVDDTHFYEYAQQTQSQLDNLRRQLQAYMERERAYKIELGELQQRLSRK